MSTDNDGTTTDDNAGSDSTSDNNQSTQDATQSATNTSNGDTSDASKTTNASDTVSREEFDALMKRMQAADRAKTSAEKKLKDIADKDLSELEKAKKDATDSVARADKVEAELKKERIFNAFLSVKDVDWHDVGDAFALLDLSGVDVDGDTGKVTGMDKAVKALADKKPHLVKTGTTGGSSTGSAHNSNRKGDQGDASKKSELQRRFPAAFISR